MAPPLLILGHGTFAVETLDIAEAAGGWEPAGFVASLERPASGARHAGLPVFWVDELPFAPGECVMVAGLVSPRRRPFIERLQGRGHRFVSVVHPSAVVSRRAVVGEGCVVHAGAIVSSNTTIDSHVVLNRGALVGHDNRIGAFVTVGPGANLAGAIAVGRSAYIGVGAVVRDHLEIGEHAVVGAGAVVVKSVPAQTLVMGVPAQPVRTGSPQI